VDAALDVDGELAVAGDLHRRVGDLTAGFRHRRVDVVDEQVGPHQRLLGVVHWGSHADHPAAGQRRRAGVAEPRLGRAEAHAVQFFIRRAHDVDVGGNDLEILNLHFVLTFGRVDDDDAVAGYLDDSGNPVKPPSG